jgi:hypothetical protein
VVVLAPPIVFPPRLEATGDDVEEDRGTDETAGSRMTSLLSGHHHLPWEKRGEEVLYAATRTGELDSTVLT